MHADLHAPDPRPTPAGFPRGRFLPLAGLALIGLLVLLVIGGGHLSFDMLLESRRDLKAMVEGRPLAAAAGFALCYTGLVALSIPGGSLLTLLAGFLFGPVAGATIAVLAATVGGACVFLLARRSFGEALRNREHGRIASVTAGIRRDALYYLLFARLTPMFPFWLVNLAAGASRVPLRIFIVATMVGIVPVTFAVAYAGSALDAIAGRESEAFQSCRVGGGSHCHVDLVARALLTPELMVAVGSLGVLALLPIALRQLRVHSRRRVLDEHAR